MVERGKCQFVARLKTSAGGRSQDWALDTAASYHSTPIEGTPLTRLARPIHLNTARGPIVLRKATVVDIPNLGPTECVYNKLSPALLSLGRLVKKGYSLGWCANSFSLVNPSGARVNNVTIEGGIPYLEGQSSNGLQCVTIAGRANIERHSLHHLPARDDCRHCALAKMKQAQARRVPEELRSIANAYLGRIMIDCIGPLPESFRKHKYIVVFLDDYSKYTVAKPLVSITASNLLREFKKAFPSQAGLPTIVRTDGGPEFQRSFKDYLIRKGIVRELGIPYRPQTRARVERHNRIVMDGVRCLLSQAGAPAGAWHLALEHWMVNFNHNIIQTRRNATPADLARRSEHATLVPWGCSCVVMSEPLPPKTKNRGEEGIVVGYADSGSLRVLPIDSKGKVNWLAHPSRSRDLRIYHTSYPISREPRDRGYPHFDIYPPVSQNGQENHDDNVDDDNDDGKDVPRNRLDSPDRRLRSEEVRQHHVQDQEEVGHSLQDQEVPLQHAIQDQDQEVQQPHMQPIMDMQPTQPTMHSQLQGDIQPQLQPIMDSQLQGDIQPPQMQIMDQPISDGISSVSSHPASSRVLAPSVYSQTGDVEEISPYSEIIADNPPNPYSTQYSIAVNPPDTHHDQLSDAASFGSDNERNEWDSTISSPPHKDDLPSPVRQPRQRSASRGDSDDVETTVRADSSGEEVQAEGSIANRLARRDRRSVSNARDFPALFRQQDYELGRRFLLDDLDERERPKKRSPRSSISGKRTAKRYKQKKTVSRAGSSTMIVPEEEVEVKDEYAEDDENMVKDDEDRSGSDRSKTVQDGSVSSRRGVKRSQAKSVRGVKRWLGEDDAKDTPDDDDAKRPKQLLCMEIAHSRVRTAQQLACCAHVLQPPNDPPRDRDFQPPDDAHNALQDPSNDDAYDLCPSNINPLLFDSDTLSFNKSKDSYELFDSSLIDDVSHKFPLFSLVTKQVFRTDPQWYLPIASKAFEKEAENLVSKGVWEWTSVQEWPSVKVEFPDARVVTIHQILGIKHWEKPAIDHVYKGRIVAGGHNVRETTGQRAEKDVLFGSPIPLDCVRMMLATAACRGWCAEVADVDGAYLLADLRGPPTFARLPKDLQPTDWKLKYSDPVVKLRKALYGLPRSGFDWYYHFEKLLVSMGWTKVPDWDSLYMRKEAILLAYVDDLVMIGRKKLLRTYWKQIDDGVKLKSDGPVALTQFLNIQVSFSQVDASHTNVSVSQSHYCKLLLERYEKEIGSSITHGVSTPMIPHSSSTKGTTMELGNDMVGLNEQDTSPGVFSKSCRTHVGGLMWLTRASRPDLQYSVSLLARKVQNWSIEDDHRLHRVFQYLYSTQDSTLSSDCYHADRDSLELCSYSDSDWAGDIDNRKSTSGWCIFLQGKSGTRFLIDWGAKQQSFIAKSSAEAETVAISKVVSSRILGYYNLLLAIGVNVEKVRHFTDSQSAMLCIGAGSSKSLRYINKTQGIHLGWLREVFSQNEFSLEYVKGTENPADLFTKPLGRVKHEVFTTEIGQVFKRL